MKTLKTTGAVTGFLLLAMLMLFSCRPIRNLKMPPTTWKGNSAFQSKLPGHNAMKKNVFIIADADLTVLFDMLAPFYLFNNTDKANVYIVSKNQTPVFIKRDLFVMPQLTFVQADSMTLPADVIVIPALSKRDVHQDTTIINWVTRHFSDSTKILAVCDGAATAAATGLYDGKPITCHASDYARLKKLFPGPNWVKDIAVTKSGNLFSTAGVSNAVEGSLTVIGELFGTETMQKVMTDISYPEPQIKASHKSIAISGQSKFHVVKKVMFRKNKSLGLLMEDGINEFNMASILETYGRSLPASFTAFNLNSSITPTKYGLTMITTAEVGNLGFDEVHLLKPETTSEKIQLRFPESRLITYDPAKSGYLIDLCLKRIGEQYGHRFEDFVKISLDYN